MEHIYEIVDKGGVFILNPLDYSDIYKYLEENHIMIDLEETNDFTDLSIIDDDLEGKEIFLVGENHGVLVNEQLRMKFLKYFKFNTNFKYYLWELPFSVAFFLSKYLETGDEKILRETSYVDWFGSILNKNPMFQDKVLSIVYIYDNCKYLYPTDLKDYQGVMTTLDSKLNILKKYAKGECTLFKLNGTDSPFDKRLLWPIVHKIPEGGVTTDYFQYIILIRNSKALTSLKV